MNDPRFTVEKLAKRLAELEEHLYLWTMPLSILWQPGRLAEADPGRWRPCPPGTVWGGLDSWAVFKTTATVPALWAGHPVMAVFRLARDEGGEGLLYLDGRPHQGIDPHHREVCLREAATSGEEWDLAIEAYTLTTGRDRPFAFAEAALAVPDRTARELYYDALVTLDAVRLLPAESLERARLLQTLDEAMLYIDWRGPLGDSFRASLTVARDALTERLRRMPAGDRPRVTAIGHSHIDVAWLWTLAQTRQKAARTFSTVLRLMERYPEYHYTQSQPQLYAFIKEDHPEILAGIKERVAEGRWEPIGGMWVEADCNLPSGESLVRQFLHGTRFFREEFGRPGTPVLWLPDVFGYSWALPQIIKRCGFKYFMTTKISWNEYNRLPYDSFRWRGPDGSEVLAHLITAPSGWKPFAGSHITTYNGRLTVQEVKGAWDNYRHKSLHEETLLAFGHGDGGGGPTAHMLEYGRRLAEMPGLPGVSQDTVGAFFDRLSEKQDRLPVWDGELYFEYHRGTYTSQSRNKKANRDSELLYHDAELFAAIAHQWHADYPQEQLDRGWELILLNQFHDIIPGSSIGPVYADSQRQYRTLLASGQQILGDALAAIVAQIDMPRDGVVVFNSTGWERCDPAEVDLPALRDDMLLIGPDGHAVPIQYVGEQGRRRILFATRGVPAHGYHVYRFADPGENPARPPSGEEGSEVRLEETAPGRYEFENSFFRVTLNEAGQITSWWDKTVSREVIPPGHVANQFQSFEDKPLSFDAWDINLYYQDKMWCADGPAKIRVLETGPVRAVLETRRVFGNSTIVQRIMAYACQPGMDFATEIDWHEKHVLLKVAFPVDIRAVKATYEIQFGNIERPTHWNTSWDWARFEVCAHKWADLSEGGYGVSLLNDGKYGHDIRDNVIRLSLLRSPAEPDPRADEGRHAFTYSLLPHPGDWRAGTIQRAYALNLPLIARFAGGHRGSRPDRFSLVRADAPNVVVETIKKAVAGETEDGRDLIVRLYEAYNQRGMVTLIFGAPIEAATECNLLETDDRPVDFAENRLTFQIKPYEIRTFKVRLRT